ncbi:unnamed protein product [Phaedon cochleariae]|uniref:Double jelly roll-like domain-containing protein n=1 Tax=Phaedon cochleariae TaxID=80249 RepID=A0A9N9SCG0_PHACE|nr:unnamed protein product [Phaedon cochleariae]
MSVCERKISELEKDISEFDYSNRDNEFSRIYTRLLHVSRRLQRILTTNKDQECTETDSIRLWSQVIGDLNLAFEGITVSSHSESQSTLPNQDSHSLLDEAIPQEHASASFVEENVSYDLIDLTEEGECSHTNVRDRLQAHREESTGMSTGRRTRVTNSNQPGSSRQPHDDQEQYSAGPSIPSENRNVNHVRFSETRSSPVNRPSSSQNPNAPPSGDYQPARIPVLPPAYLHPSCMRNHSTYCLSTPYSSHSAEPPVTPICQELRRFDSPASIREPHEHRDIQELPNGPTTTTTTTVEVQIHSVVLKVKHVFPNDEIKLQLMQPIKNDTPILIPFRKWDLSQLPALTNGAKSEIWAVKTSASVERPRYVIVCFQKSKRDNAEADATHFDNTSIVSIRLALNGEYWPNERMQLDFAKQDYTLAYYNYTRFYSSYSHSTEVHPILDYGEFKQHALFVIDCSRQEETMKSSTVDIKLEIEADKGFPADTKAYCIIVHDCLLEYFPLTEVVRTLI